MLVVEGMQADAIKIVMIMLRLLIYDIVIFFVFRYKEIVFAFLFVVDSVFFILGDERVIVYYSFFAFYRCM